MVHVNTVHQSDPIIGVGTASLTDPVKQKATTTRRISHKSYKENRNATTCA